MQLTRKTKTYWRDRIRHIYLAALVSLPALAIAASFAAIEPFQPVVAVEPSDTEVVVESVSEPLCDLADVDCEAQPDGKGGIDGTYEVTAYSEFDSCHTGPDCLMASGKRAYIGAVACPRSIPFGTKVNIVGDTYVCEDRTAQWVDGRFDIFMGFGQDAYDAALSFGVQALYVFAE